MIIKKLKTKLMLLIYELMFVQIQAKEVLVNSGDEPNSILNNAQGGDTVLVKPGLYAQINTNPHSPQKWYTNF